MVFPICSHDLPNTEQIIEKIIDIFQQENPHSMIANVATDQDAGRRRILTNRRETFNVHILNIMKYFDCNLFMGRLSLN